MIVLPETVFRFEHGQNCRCGAYAENRGFFSMALIMQLVQLVATSAFFRLFPGSKRLGTEHLSFGICDIRFFFLGIDI